VQLVCWQKAGNMVTQLQPIQIPKERWLEELKWQIEACLNNRKPYSEAAAVVKAELKRWKDNKEPNTPSEKEGSQLACMVYGIPHVIEPDNWEEVFPKVGECKLPAKEVIVDELLLKGCIHVWAGMFESFKTMAAIELSSAILDNRSAFDHFKVNQQYPVLYLCPDMSPELFQEYITPFGLMGGKEFRWQSPDSEVFYTLDSPVLERAVEGRLLVLDTMLDYAQIQKAFESGEWIGFFKKLRRLINVCGCVAIIMLVHPTKSGARSNTIDPSEYLKDSVTFGGKIDVGLAFSKLPDTSQVFVQRIKGRGFKQQQFTFTIAYLDDDGNSNLDRGRFPVYLKPGEAGKKQDHAENKGGRPKDPDRQRKIDFARKVDGSWSDKAKAVNEEFGSKHDRNTIGKWLKETLPFDSNEGDMHND
jgi:hypothetical protein